ncbi:MAG: HDOD domain-containing protein [Gammaproteobacteria bacterium]|nr:HDOD domain-containing protein [Gammaproteobacteria bacterium]
MEQQQAQAGGGFSFVELLAKEVSRGNLEVPGFPDVALRIRKVLADPNCDASKVAKIVAGEPVLTARIIRMANSAALKPANATIKDARTAVARMGFSLVQSATVSFAAEQMKLVQRYEGAKTQFDAIWRRSTHVAAVAYVLAKRCARSVNPDEALLAGLMHAIGKLYILSRGEDHPEIFANDSDLERIMADWYVSVGEAILQSWNFDDEIVTAVGAQLDHEREPADPISLADVMIVALPLPSVLGRPEDMAEVLDATRAGQRLGLSTDACIEVLAEASEQIDELRSALRE